MILPRARRPAAVAAAVLAVVVGLTGCDGSPAAPSAGPASSRSAKPGARTDVPTPAASQSPGPSPSPTGGSTGPVRLAISQLSWRLPVPTGREAAGVVDGALVVAGGLVAGDRSTDHAWRIDLASGRPTALGALPHAVHDVAGVVVGGRLLAVGGGASTESAAVQRVGPSSSQVGSLPSPRADLAAVSTPRGVVVLGGYDGSSMPRDVLVSSDGTRWRTAGRLAVGVRYPAVVLDGTTLWVVGGERNGAPVDTIQALDLRTGRSRVTAHLPHALGHACAGLLAGRVVLAGGRTAGGVTDRVVWLDPATGATTPAGRLPRPLADAAAVPVGGDLLLVGGESPRVTDHVLRLHA